MNYPAFARVDLLSYGESYATFAESENMMAPDYSKLNFNARNNFGNQQLDYLLITSLTREQKHLEYALILQAGDQEIMFNGYHLDLLA